MKIKGFIHIIILLAVICVLPGCSSLLFYPDHKLYPIPEQAGIQPVDVYFKTADGLRLHGWFLAAKTKKAKGSVLFTHGNAQNISSHVASVFWLPDYGYNVFLFDYRGYGFSEGEPELEKLQLDFNAALDRLKQMPGVDPQRIFIFGQSLGAAVAIYSTAHYPQRTQLRGIIVEGAFGSYRQIAREALGNFWLTWAFQWPLSFTISDCCRPLDAVSDLSPLPILIVHSKQDEVIPFHHALDLYKRARQPKTLWVYEGFRHIQIFTIDKNRQRLVKYMDSLLPKN